MIKSVLIEFESGLKYKFEIYLGSESLYYLKQIKIVDNSRNHYNVETIVERSSDLEKLIKLLSTMVAFITSHNTVLYTSVS